MLVMIDSMYPSRSPAILDRKRTQDVLMLDNRQPAVQHSSDSAQTSSVPAQPYPKRQRFSREEQHPIYVQSSTAVPDRQSCSGSLQSAHPVIQSELQWTASDGYSTCNSLGKQDTMMEEDQQSVTPALQLHQQIPSRNNAMSHSSSAPDLRLLLATELPSTKTVFLPVQGSYAGAMVPYKSLEQVIAEAHQYVTSDLIKCLDESPATEAHPSSATETQGASLEAMEVVTKPASNQSRQHFAATQNSNLACGLRKRRPSLDPGQCSSRKCAWLSAAQLKEVVPTSDNAGNSVDVDGAASMEIG